MAAKKFRLPLWAKIILGMILGIIWGLIAVRLGMEKFTSDWVKPWGTIFIKLLKLIAVPLIFISLVKGITSITDMTKLSRIGLKTLALYLLTTVIAISAGLLLVNAIKPGDSFSEEKKMEFQARYQDSIKEKEEVAASVQEKSPLFFFEEMVPDNIFMAAGDNSKMLQIIFFSLLFSIAMIVLEAKKVTVVSQLFEGLNDIILKMVDIIMMFAPIGVFALLSALVTEFSGDGDLFIALGKYAGLTFFGILVMVFTLYPLFLKLFSKIKIRDFFNAIIPVQMVAFSTSSSAATLPVTLKACTEKLKISEGVANFVLPVGVTINMNGTSFYQAISAVFIAQVFGLDLTFSQQLTIILTATLASIGTPGVPGGAIIMLVIVLTTVGIPAEGLALIMGIERPLDMMRTVANITGDATVAAIVATSEDEIGKDAEPELSEVSQL
ncbi:MAG: dicarboxylate/amino acid:cation symporter [Marinilabiliaceae bacterium]|jgi:Na+/H+-dicarboxylate symporter|nr:dicarboxylate/amino acid:cation symporter [Marinilabiliaceae bacterium]